MPAADGVGPVGENRPEIGERRGYVAARFPDLDDADGGAWHRELSQLCCDRRVDGGGSLECSRGLGIEHGSAGAEGELGQKRPGKGELADQLALIGGARSERGGARTEIAGGLSE